MDSSGSRLDSLDYKPVKLGCTPDSMANIYFVSAKLDYNPEKSENISVVVLGSVVHTWAKSEHMWEIVVGTR